MNFPSKYTWAGIYLDFWSPQTEKYFRLFHKLHTPLCLIFLLTFTIFAHSFMSLLLGFCLTFRPHCIDDLSILAWRCTWETILKQKYSGKNFPVRKFRTNQDQGRGWAKNTVWAFFLISAIIPNYFFCTFFFKFVCWIWYFISSF